MGWFWGSKQNPEDSQTEQEKDSNIQKNILSEGRQACYKARDNFYACMEKKKNSKPTEIATVGLLYPAECKPARAEYVKHCRPTWVKHFDRQYSAKRRVERLLEEENSQKGPMSLPQATTFKQ